VAISGDRLRAAIAESGISVAKLARKIRMNQPTLQYVVSGKTKRCRASRRAVLANEFGVQEAWLAGEQEAGPFYDRQLAWAEQHGTIVLPEERQVALPPLAQLRAARLVETCLERWERDLAEGIAPPPDRHSVLGQVRGNYKGKDLTLWLGTYLEYLLCSASILRMKLYEYPQLRSGADSGLFTWFLSRDEKFTVAWISALEQLLSPWIEGLRQLDYPACYRLLEELARNQKEFVHRVRRGGITRVPKGKDRR
jgi:transcriptional regulator with XRE-family HTH domain